MKVITNTRPFRAVDPLLYVLAVAFSASVATAQGPSFVDDFSGPSLDSAWTINDGDNPGGHLGINAGRYEMTDAFGAPGAKIQRFFPEDTATTYTHEIEVVLDPFGLTGGGGARTDFKWKSFGPDGFMEVVLNSFGDMRLFHNDSDGGAGNLQPNTNIGYTDGDLLKLTTAYDQGTDTIDVTYSLNGGPAVGFYSGGGIDGPVGNLITNFVEVEVFKWGETPPDQATAKIDYWNLASIPEPTAAALLAIGSCLPVGRSRQR